MRGFRRMIRHRRRLANSGPAVGDRSGIKYLVRLLASFTQPKEVLTAYLGRSLRGFSFRRAVEEVAGGAFGGQRSGTPSGEIVVRAASLLRWLDGEEMDGRDPHTVLGVSRSATKQAIVHRYRILSKRVHPDRHSSARQDYWCARQKEVNEAYRMLTDPKFRTQWEARVEKRKQLLLRLWQRERTCRK